MINKRPLCIVLFVTFIQQSLSVAVIQADNRNVKFQAKQKQSLTLSCNVSETDHVEVKWAKEDIPIASIKDLTGRYTQSNSKSVHKLVISKLDDSDAGRYSCSAYQNEQNVSTDYIQVTSQIVVKIPANVNVVEGERLRLQCLVMGNPAPIIRWEYANATYNITFSENTTRVTIENDKEKSNVDHVILRIEQVELYDRGNFTCIGHSPDSNDEVSSVCMVRIKDKYAALWPFLGICAEVFILCAIIFIYEKKRNKTELEESDTDQSPDQKNTPDHEKDSNLRHRQ